MQPPKIFLQIVCQSDHVCRKENPLQGNEIPLLIIPCRRKQRQRRYKKEWIAILTIFAGDQKRADDATHGAQSFDDVDDFSHESIIHEKAGQRTF